MTATEVMAKLLSECGIISVLFSVAVVWLALQLAKEREAREEDRKTALNTIERYSKAYENVIVSNSKLEGMLSNSRKRNASC